MDASKSDYLMEVKHPLKPVYLRYRILEVDLRASLASPEAGPDWLQDWLQDQPQDQIQGQIPVNLII